MTGDDARFAAAVGDADRLGDPPVAAGEGLRDGGYRPDVGGRVGARVGHAAGSGTACVLGSPTAAASTKACATRRPGRPEDDGTGPAP